MGYYWEKHPIRARSKFFGLLRAVYDVRVKRMDQPHRDVNRIKLTLEADPDSLETFQPALQVIDDCMSPTATKDPIEIKIYAFFTLASVSLDP